MAGKSGVLNHKRRRVHHQGTVFFSGGRERWRTDGGNRQETGPNKANIAARKMLFVFNEGMKKRNTS